MLHLERSVAVWGSAAFETAVQQELAAHQADLPLLRALTQGNQLTDEPIAVLLKRAIASEGEVALVVTVFFESVNAGCSCANDPTPIGTEREMCELAVWLDLATASARIELLD